MAAVHPTPASATQAAPAVPATRLLLSTAPSAHGDGALRAPATTAISQTRSWTARDAVVIESAPSPWRLFSGGRESLSETRVLSDAPDAVAAVSVMLSAGGAAGSAASRSMYAATEWASLDKRRLRLATAVAVASCGEDGRERALGCERVREVAE